MRIPVTNELEMLREPRLFQHIVSVAADGEDSSRFHVVVVIQSPTALESRDGPLVDDGLAVILAVRLEAVQLK